MLVLEMGTGRLSLYAGRAGAVVSRDEHHVGQRHRRTATVANKGWVQAVLQQQAELIALGLPDGQEADGAVAGCEGGVGVGVQAVGEGRGGGGGGGEVGHVEGEFVRGRGVGDEGAVGADGFEEGEIVETDCCVLWEGGLVFVGGVAEQGGWEAYR